VRAEVKRTAPVPRQYWANGNGNGNAMEMSGDEEERVSESDVVGFVRDCVLENASAKEMVVMAGAN
jgi:hypothetical protein